MSGPDRNASDHPESGSESVRGRIAQELAALGEDPLAGPGDDDLALAFALGDGDPHADIDVATLQTLAGWAEPPELSAEPGAGPGPKDDELSEFAQARVWRTIELRSKLKKDDGAVPVATARSTRPVLLGTVVALLAVAAGVVLVPVLTADTREPSGGNPVARAPTSVTAEELDVLSTQARAGLAALDRISGEPTGTARVEALASDYAGRLKALGNSQGQAADPRGSQG